MASVFLGDIGLQFAWQAWRLVTSTFTLRGRGTYGTGLALVARLGLAGAAALCMMAGVELGDIGHRSAVCVAGVALGDIDLHSAWQAWRLQTSLFSLCGRPGACRH